MPGPQTEASGQGAGGTHKNVRGMRHVDLTDVQLASSETARRINRDIVLELIRTGQPISRADLARRSGLQRSTVSQIVEQLIREKWVREGSIASAPRGRRPTLIGLNEDLVAIAVDIHPRQAIVAVVDLNGRLLSRAMVPLTSDPEASTRLMIESMQRMRRTVPKKSTEGIGISLPGRVDPGTQRLTFAPNLHWPDFDLKKVIETEDGASGEDGERRNRVPAGGTDVRAHGWSARRGAGHRLRRRGHRRLCERPADLRSSTAWRASSGTFPSIRRDRAARADRTDAGRHSHRAARRCVISASCSPKAGRSASTSC